MVMNNKRVFSTFIFCLFLGLSKLNSQIKYFVKFTDKNGTPYSISTPTAFLTPSSVARRTNYLVPYDNTDLPVNPSYISQIAGVSNVTVLYPLKWFNGVVVAIPSNFTTTAVSAINAFTFVANTGLVNKYKLNKPEEVVANAATENQALRSSNSSSFSSGGSAWQNKQIRVDCLHGMGFRGQGMVIAVMDAGFSNVDVNPVFDSLRNRGGIKGTRDFVSGGTSVYEDAAHGAHVLSCMAAIKPNVIMGSAPMADYWLLRTEDVTSEKLIEEYNWVRAAEFADSVGADILTTSLGYTTFDNSTQNHSYATLNGKTAPMSIASTMAVRKGMFVLTAAGNEGGGGWNYISVAGDADSICTVGAIDSLSNVGSFSGVGPTSDGRIKPDLVARGVAAWVADVNGFCVGANGTSFSTPILAGGVACCWQRNRFLTTMQLLKNLRNTASNAASPNNSRGWGTPDLCALMVGLDENKLTEQSVHIYPNPFNASFVIASSGQSFQSVELIDLLGHVLKQVPINETDQVTNVNTFDLSDGIYFVRINTINGSITKKIIKQ